MNAMHPSLWSLILALMAAFSVQYLVLLTVPTVVRLIKQWWP